MFYKIFCNVNMLGILHIAFRVKLSRGDIMFKIEKTEHINKTFRMPCDLVNELEELAQKEDISLNQLVIQCCKYALKNLDKENN